MPCKNGFFPSFWHSKCEYGVAAMVTGNDGSGPPKSYARQVLGCQRDLCICGEGCAEAATMLFDKFFAHYAAYRRPACVMSCVRVCLTR